MSEDAGAALPPYVLDVSALTAVARGDAGVMSLVQALDGQGRPLVIPVLAVTAASLDARSDDADELLEGLERLENVLAAPVQDAEQAVRLAAVVARTNLDPWDAHGTQVADASVCAILTADAARWREHARDLEEPLHFIEIAEPGSE